MANSKFVSLPARVFARHFTKNTIPPVLNVNGKQYKTDDWTNVTPSILALTERSLHLQNNHPVSIIRTLIEKRFAESGYTYYNKFKPVVTTAENFDTLGFPKDHPGRAKSDTYYINENNLLRTHTSAHESQCFNECPTDGYFISADVYRKDEIDKTHYPVFHQMEGARVWKRTGNEQEFLAKIEADIAAIPKADNLIVEDAHPPFSESNPKQSYMTDRETELVGQHLKRTLELLVSTVFSEAQRASGKEAEPLRVRWTPDYFPWTSPSWEIEVFWNGEWLECCGCGVVREQVLTNVGIKDTVSWAFGVGLDRIAMLTFGIPDIRLFWSQDERFLNQFKEGEISLFKPYSKYPGTVRDVAFWMPSGTEIHENDIMGLVREVAGDLVENVKLVDEFTHPKTGKKSRCYRVNYQSMDRNLTNDEINQLQNQVRDLLVENYNVELR